MHQTTCQGLLEYHAGTSVAPQRAEIRPLPTRSDDDQGGSHRYGRLIQPFRHQIQLLTARPAPAELDYHVARLECLVKDVHTKKIDSHKSHTETQSDPQ